MMSESRSPGGGAQSCSDGGSASLAEIPAATGRLARRAGPDHGLRGPGRSTQVCSISGY